MDSPNINEVSPMIFVLSGADAHQFPKLMEDVYRLRHQVFVDELGWSDLRRDDGLEIDQFDTPDAVHHIAVHDDKVVGYQRMLPTTMPHLLSDVFPELCEVEYPKSLDTYELTRYCVRPAYRTGRRGVSSVGSELMAGFVEWGLSSGVHHVIIEFETIWVLRALQLKFLAQPLGYETKIGTQNITATKVTFNHQTLTKIREYRGNHEPVVRYLGQLEPERHVLAS